MAALSYYTNWDTFQPTEMMNTDTSFLAQQETQLFPDQFFDYDSFDELFPDSSYSNEIDHLFEPNDILYSENYNNNNNIPNQLPYNNNNMLTPLPDYTLHTPLVEFDPFQDLKRQKLFDTYNFPLHSDRLINPGLLQHNFQPEFVLPEFVTAPPVYSGGSYAETVTKPPPASGGGSLSAQSASARQRRRKITDKTHELGKLVPGGQKMNTAEMLQSAYKYIKFLQAEVGILESMGSYNHQEKENGDQSELMHGLITSPLIQEKLYSAEKCMVPEKFVQALANDDDDITLQLKPQLSKEIKELRIIDLSN
ncbi:hypothetical protein ABFS83_08G121800 [Erythranthe nasuta]